VLNKWISELEHRYVNVTATLQHEFLHMSESPIQTLHTAFLN